MAVPVRPRRKGVRACAGEAAARFAGGFIRAASDGSGVLRI